MSKECTLCKKKTLRLWVNGALGLMELCPACKKSALIPYMGGQFGMYECKNCKYVGVLVIEKNKFDTPAYYRSGFDTWLAYLYDWSFSLAFFGNARKLRREIALSIPHKARRVLDLATGTGDVALQIKEIHPETIVYGVDLAQKMLDIAQQKSKRQGLGVHWVKKNVEKTGFKDDSFDAVTISFGLHELPTKNRPAVVQEAYRVLGKGGRFIVMDFHKPKNLILKALFAIFLKLFEEPYAKTLLKTDLPQELQRAGFRHVHKSYNINNLVQLVVGIK